MKFLIFFLSALFLAVGGDSNCEDKFSLPGGLFSASSSYDNNYFVPGNAKKLDGSASWCPTYEDTAPYIQVKFKKMANVVKIVTQGRPDYHQWCTEYTLMFSQDGVSFGDIQSSGGSKHEMLYTLRIFIVQHVVSASYGVSNSDTNTKVTSYLPYPVTMRYLRIYVTQYHGLGCMRIGVYGCDPLTSKGCESYLLPHVTNDKLMASSIYSSNYDLTHSRLNSDNAWCPSSPSGEHYIQVEFSQLTNVIGIVTKGRTDSASLVKSYIVKFSQDGTYWHDVLRDNGATKVFRGNWDKNTKLENMFEHLIPVKYLRIYTQSYETWPCLRFDVIGCIAPSVMSCGDYLVSGVDPIDDNMITASSYYNSGLLPSYGRITTSTYWCSTESDRSQAYFQVHFRSTKKVAGFLHKGDPNHDNTMLLYSISYSSDGGKTWQNVKKDDGKTRIFFGNRDRYSMMLNMLDTPIEAKVIRFNTKVSYGHVSCGSFEVLGCNPVPEIRMGFYGQFVPMKVDSSFQPYSLWQRTSDILTCIRHCSVDNECMSFTYRRQGEICHGYSAMLYRDDNKKPQASEHMYYIDRSFLDGHGYTISESAVLCYKIFTQAVSHTTAAEKCKELKTNLLPIRTAEHLKEIQTVLEKSKDVIKNGLHVGGKYNSTKLKWLYHDNTFVDDSLWSASGKNTNTGHCIVVTKDGLTSADCNSKVFFACGL